MNNGANDKLPADKTYALKYHVDEGRFKAGDQKSDEGLTDALVLMSILHFSDGSSSTMLMSIDGRETPVKALPAGEMLLAWSIMAHELMQSKELPEHLKLICETAFESVREQILLESKHRN